MYTTILTIINFTIHNTYNKCKGNNRHDYMKCLLTILYNLLSVIINNLFPEFHWKSCICGYGVLDGIFQIMQLLHGSQENTFHAKMVHGNDYRHKEPAVLRTGNLHVQIQLENAEPN